MCICVTDRDLECGEVLPEPMRVLYKDRILWNKETVADCGLDSSSVGQASFESGANLLKYSVRRVVTDQRDTSSVPALSDEVDALRVAGSAKTVSQPVLPEKRKELGRAGRDIT